MPTNSENTKTQFLEIKKESEIKKKRPIKELLAEYEKKRIEYDKENEQGKIIGTDGNMIENLN